MLIEKKEVDRFLNLLGDIRSRRLPVELGNLALLAFFVENPHLFMVEDFDEHMQQPLTGFQGEVLDRLPEDDPVIADFGEYGSFDFPNLEFRSQTGRWAGLIDIPPLYDWPKGESPEFLLSFTSRYVLKHAAKLRYDSHLEDSQGRGRADAKFKKRRDELREELHSDVRSVSVEDLISDLNSRVARPRESSSVLWSPKFWTSREQARQRSLLEGTLAPHLARWTKSNVCFDDLNPSEFEDLIGEVLLAGGLKIHKVREVPQGGRDLIARGMLISGEEPVEMAVEVKHRRVVDRPEVQLALYQNRMYPALIFVTSGRFTAGVFEEKAMPENRLRLLLRDGLAIGDLVRMHFGLESPIRAQHKGARGPRPKLRQF